MAIQRIGTELHRTGNDDLGGNGVENIAVFEDDETGNICNYLSLSELLTHVDLDTGQPHSMYNSKVMVRVMSSILETSKIYISTWM